MSPSIYNIKTDDEALIKVNQMENRHHMKAGITRRFIGMRLPKLGGPLSTSCY